jgi:hypothetical protein
MLLHILPVTTEDLETKSPMQEFQELGNLIESRWRAQNYSEQLFPEIAAQALAESDLPAKVDPWEIIRWVHTTPTLPEQKDVPGRFGNPPITLFSGPRFHIDVYYWLDGTTSIHQHAFTGAFQVLLGSSIHSHYSFREDRILNEHFSIGELELQTVELLQVNDIKLIKPGRQYIHSLFHLERPSATITVRTEHTPSATPQYDYRKPYFAIDPFFQNVAMMKKLQTVTLLLGMKHREAESMIGDLVASSDFHTTYFILLDTAHHLRHDEMEELFGLSTGKERFNTILNKARTVHGELVDKFLSVLDEQERQQNIVLRRGNIKGEEHRFFLALLLNVASREKILGLVKQRFPETDPVEKILDWVEELSQTRVLGSKEANALGIEGFGDEHLFVFEHQLRGASVQDIKALASNGSQGFATGLDQRLESVAQSLQNSMLFKSVLSQTLSHTP